MNIRNLSAALMGVGLLIATPAFSQSAQKQPTQEGGSFSPLPCGEPYNANPGADPNCARLKQPTQEGGPSMVGPTGGAFNADPSYNPYKQHTQNLMPLTNEASVGKK